MLLTVLAGPFKPGVKFGTTPGVLVKFGGGAGAALAAGAIAGAADKAFTLDTGLCETAGPLLAGVADAGAGVGAGIAAGEGNTA